MVAFTTPLTPTQATAASNTTPTMNTMNLDLPIRTVPKRNDESRNALFTQSTPSSSTEAIGGPVREHFAAPPPNDRLIVGVDFGTTYSG